MPIKKQRFFRLKKKRKLHATYKKLTLNIKIKLG